jgi:chromosome segregation ATPase
MNDKSIRRALNSFPQRVLDLSDAYESVRLEVICLKKIDKNLSDEVREVHKEYKRICRIGAEWDFLLDILSGVEDDFYNRLEGIQEKLDDAEEDLWNLEDAIEIFHLNLNDCKIKI